MTSRSPDDVVTVWLVAEPLELSRVRRKLEVDSYSITWAGAPGEWPGLGDEVPDLIVGTAASASSRRWTWIQREAEQRNVAVAVLGSLPSGPDDELANAQALPRPG